MGYGVDKRFHNISGGKWRVPKPYFKETSEDLDRSGNHINKMFEILRDDGNQVEII